MAGCSALCALILLATAAHSRTATISQHPDALSTLRGELLDLHQSLWRKILDPRWHEVTDSNAQGPDIAVAKAFHKFSQRLSAREWTQQIDSSVLDWWVWSRLTAEMKTVNKVYNAFDIHMRYQANQKVPSPSEKWIKLAKDATQNATLALDRIFDFIMHGNVYLQLIKESNMHMCELKQSQSQLLYNMYNTILLTEIKGYSVIQFSWMILRLYGKGNYTEEANMATDRYNERTAMTMSAIKGALAIADRVLWRCDPEYHVEGNTYLQLKRFLQGYIENEVDMNPDSSCKENCAYYSIGVNRGCFKQQFCSRQSPCKGKILNCRYIESDMQICMATQTKNVTRRYDYIAYENGRTLGRRTSCPRGVTQVDSWWRWGVYHCSYCLCVCEYTDMSDRYFSMREIISDTEHNKVITGIRFTKVDRVIHLQINEGTLLPGAVIDHKSVVWRQVDPIDIRKATKGVDYHEMTNEERAVDLDDLQGSPGHVLTGIRFRKLGAHLNFEIQTMPFDFESGKLITNKAVWISNDNTGASSKPRTKVVLQQPDIPIRAPGRSLMNSKDDQYIEFDHSDFDADVGQTAVPFIDAQPVIPNIPTPLTGAGIYHKGLIRSGGYIAPKIFTYDFTDHILEVFNTEAEESNAPTKFANYVPLV